MSFAGGRKALQVGSDGERVIAEKTEKTQQCLLLNLKQV